VPILRETAGKIRAAKSLRVWLLYLPGPGPRLMSWLRKRWVLWRNPHAHIEFQGPVYLGPGFSLDARLGGTFIVGPAVEFRRGFRAELAHADARITIGAGSVFTYDVILQCSSSIEIGEHCVFAHASTVVDGSHRFRDLDRRLLDQGYALRPIKIADHATISAKCTVIADVGERTFVGANAVVARPLPPFCVAVGVPAGVIEYFGPPDQVPPELSDGCANADSPG
jgi:acetyltransferase-like isoleucine patch superfamily enzyme